MRIILISISIICSQFLQAQLKDQGLKPSSVFSIGILHGGGSLIGVDYEMKVGKQLAIQGGVGINSFGFALNYHADDELANSFYSLCYWNQGFGEDFYLRTVGLTYVYRSKGWFTSQFGVGFPLEYGPLSANLAGQPPVILLYSIGAYFPQYF